MTCTCIVGRTLTPEALAALDEALRAATPLRELEKAHSVKRSTLGRHKLGCLATGGQDGDKAGQEAPTPPGDRDGAPRARVPTAQNVSGDVPGTGDFTDHVRAIADMIIAREWKGRRSVTLLSERWGLSREAVRERHRAGAAAVALDRGELAQALERAIAEGDGAAEHAAKKASELEEAGDVDSLQLAAKYRALEKGWTEKRWQLEGLLVSRMSVSIEGDPRIAGIWPVLWTAAGELDAAMREHAEIERGRLRAFVAAVERLTGGPLPAEVAALVAGGEPAPSVVDTIERAVRAYEERMGARAPALAERSGA